MTQPPHTAPAMTCPATRSALRGRSLFWGMALVAGLVCAALTVWLFAIDDGLHSKRTTGLIHLGQQLSGVGFVTGTILGAGMLWVNRRVRRALRDHPWQVWPISYTSDQRYEWITLLGPEREPVSQMTVSSWVFQIGKLVNETTPEIWFAGDPASYGVISAPGGGRPRYVAVPKLARHQPPASPHPSEPSRHAR